MACYMVREFNRLIRQSTNGRGGGSSGGSLAWLHLRFTRKIICWPNIITEMPLITTEGTASPDR